MPTAEMSAPATSRPSTFRSGCRSSGAATSTAVRIDGRRAVTARATVPANAPPLPVTLTVAADRSYVWARFGNSERGASLVEYALLLGQVQHHRRIAVAPGRDGCLR